MQHNVIRKSKGEAAPEPAFYRQPRTKGLTAAKFKTTADNPCESSLLSWFNIGAFTQRAKKSASQSEFVQVMDNANSVTPKMIRENDAITICLTIVTRVQGGKKDTN